MLRLRNDVGSLKELFEKKRRVVLYGAGAAAKLLLQSYYRIFPKESLEYIIDGNDSLDGTYCAVDGGTRIKIISIKHFCAMWGEDTRRFTLLLTPYYSLFMIKQLDLVDALDQVEAYVYPFMVNRTPPKKFSLRNADRRLIPKIIHYFWIGGEPLPREYQKNIESWKRFCPGYRIVEWNEENFDFRKYRYAREAIENGQYMYATDVARKAVLYAYGGIYFDTDVELLGPIDDLLYNEAFIGIDDGGQLNSGSGLGALKGNRVIREMLELYAEKTFVQEDGSYNLHFNTYYETKLMIERGFKIENQFQKVAGMSCLPRTVLMPKGVVGTHSDYTDKTVANHKINPYDEREVAAVRDRLYE